MFHKLLTEVCIFVAVVVNFSLSFPSLNIRCIGEAGRTRWKIAGPFGGGEAGAPLPLLGTASASLASGCFAAMAQVQALVAGRS